MSGYSHRQSGPWGPVLEALGLGALGVALWRAFQGRLNTDFAFTFGAAAAVLLASGGLFSCLNVRDKGDRLSVRFGPIGLFGTSVPYGAIESVEAARTRLVDGFGMHGLPGVYIVLNIWGMQAVRIRLKRRCGLWRARTVLIGTDEPEALLAFLRGRARQSAPQS